MSLLYRTDELRRFEERAQAGLPPGTLMQRAGRSAANWIDVWLRGRRGHGPASGDGVVLFLCGPGNNGGDGYACAAALQTMGYRCVCWTPRNGHRGDALAARRQWEQSGGRVTDTLPPSSEVAVAVDALFGIGMARALDEPFLGALRWTQAQSLPLLALDLPSGLDAGTGAWAGGVAGTPALATITFLGDKPGLHTFEGIDAAGEITLAGLDVQDPQPAGLGRLNGPEQFSRVLRRRPANSNKGDFGSLAVVGGAPGMAGAALLAARAGLRLGAGKVYVAFPAPSSMAVDPVQPELMIRAASEISDLGADALVVGCGLGTGEAARACVLQSLAFAGPLLLDADALNLLAKDKALRTALCERAAGGTVVTPHPGEAGRLLGLTSAQVQADRIGHALALARELGAVVVLKGAGSVIALPPALERAAGMPYAVNPTGTSALASAGTGDVLSGMIGALLSAGACANEDPPSLLESVLAGVWLHGRAAQDFGATVGLCASDVAPLAAKALSHLRAARADC
jgi:hydroxyethylthiazole kinase-like uncharacterized protein yjeF